MLHSTTRRKTKTKQQTQEEQHKHQHSIQPAKESTTSTTTTTEARLSPAVAVMLTEQEDERFTCSTTKWCCSQVQTQPLGVNSKSTHQQKQQQQRLHRLPRHSRLPFGRHCLTISILICLCLAMHSRPTEAADRLLGDLQSCSNEGEEVQLRGIKNSKCFKCACQNGFVNCDKESCPSIDDCYLLEPKGMDTCCRKCRGCVFRGVAYASGSEWSDPEDPCKTYKCIANVITETTMKCYTQCDEENTIPPQPGECCPTCRGCKINGQVVPKGQEVVASIDDRCLVCQCSEDKLKCVKKTCPILQCPISRQKKDPDECCPRCTEHREFMAINGRCIFNKQVLLDKAQFTPDRCTNCTCSNGTSICQRHTCPILECAPEFQTNEGCCPRCISSEVRSECIFNGVTYLSNQTWNLGPCRSCRCTTAGTVRCSQMLCPHVKCRSNEELKTPPGECCPKCMETAGTCTVFGDPHFKTFDGKFFSFQGSCKYLLTKDCRNHSFSIRLTNDGRGTKRSSWAKTVTLKVEGWRVNLGQKMRVKINGSLISLPYGNQSGPIVSIERNAETVILKSVLGVNIEWDGNNFLQITAPASYKRRLCGLCGNFNGIGRDDLTSRDGTNHSEQEVWRFANSWKVGGPKACSRVRENIAAQPTCKQRKWNQYCRALRNSEVFGNCDNRLNPNNYFESCRMDVCECPGDSCHCDSFAAYAHECKRLGVQVPDWRNATNCPVGVGRRNMPTSLVAREQQQHRSGYRHRDKQQKQRARKKQQEQEKNQLLEHKFIEKHVPRNLLVNKQTPPGRTQLPIH